MSEIKVNKISPKQTCTTVTLGDSGDDFVVATGANLKTAAVKDTAGNVIVSRCGSNITIGSSGAAIALACGATQTGFGRTGTVDWDTTAKTAGFTAVSGTGYFVNTTSGAVTMTLPATPSPGDIVAVKDYAGTFATNNLTIARNGSNLEGSTYDKVVSTNFQNFTMVYVDGTQGWIATDSGTDTISTLPVFITATGGTVTCCGDYKIHTFTGPGTFCVSCAGNPAGSNSVDYLVVAGGGSASRLSTPINAIFVNGGGGAGGYRESHCATVSGCYTASPLATPTSLQLSVQAYPITVGGGGASGSSGSNSIFSSITSAGGGAGGVSAPGSGPIGLNGGSGGGGFYSGTAGSGNTPPVSPPQGNNGGDGGGSTSNGAGGGGGASAVGTTASGGTAGPGGAGATSSISTSPTIYAGGGGGGSGGGTAGSGGPGGGGAGATGLTPVASQGTPGTANTGGGGGGNADYTSSGAAAATGGSGIVIIRYKFQ